MPRDLPPLLLNPVKVKSLILHALENVVPRCCHSKSPAMCLNPMQYAVAFLDEKESSHKFVPENCNSEPASATQALCNSQQNVFRFNVNSSWCNISLGQR